MPIYTELGAKSYQRSFSSKDIKFSDLTFRIEGQDLGEMKQLWQDIVTSEMRMDLMSTLQNKKVGFREIENFSLGLKYSFKSSKMKEQSDKPTESVVEAAIKVKLRDEKFHYRELINQRDLKKKELREKYHPKYQNYKKIIKFLRQEASEMKKKQREKYRSKAELLKKACRKEEEEETGAPKSMLELGHLSVFSCERFEKVKRDEMHVPEVGHMLLSHEEKSILRRSPKFAFLRGFSRTH